MSHGQLKWSLEPLVVTLVKLGTVLDLIMIHCTITLILMDNLDRRTNTKDLL